MIVLCEISLSGGDAGHDSAEGAALSRNGAGLIYKFLK